MDINLKVSRMLSTRNVMLQESFDNFNEDEVEFDDLNEIKGEVQFEEDMNKVKIELERPKSTQMRINYRDITQHVKKNDGEVEGEVNEKAKENIII